MAKSKKRKSLLPKRFAGMKVPKALRKGRAGRFLTSSAGVALMGEALAMAGIVGATRKADPESRLGKLRDNPKQTLMAAGSESSAAMRAAFTAAADAFAEALRKSADTLDSSPKKPGPRTEPRAAH